MVHVSKSYTLRLLQGARSPFFICADLNNEIVLLVTQVELADCMQTLFRGNSLASKIMAFCFKMYGSNYLHSQLEPLIKEMMDPELMYISYEVDPAR